MNIHTATPYTHDFSALVDELELLLNEAKHYFKHEPFKLTESTALTGVKLLSAPLFITPKPTIKVKLIRHAPHLGHHPRATQIPAKRRHIPTKVKVNRSQREQAPQMKISIKYYFLKV